MAKLIGNDRRRARRAIKAAANGRPRLSVHRSSMHIACSDHRRRQGRDPGGGVDHRQIAAQLQLKTGADKSAATAVGKLIAERARKAGVTEVVFDRGQFLYHGRVKALADAAREGGLEF